MFTKSDIADIYPLAPMQESILLYHRLHPEASRTYLEQRSYRITGFLDIVELQKAFDRLVERHACLRTLFVSEKSKRPLQIVLKPRPIPWQQQDLSTVPADEQKEAVAEVRRVDLEKGINCEKELPVRITLLVLGDSSHELIWTMHHIVVDGWSAAILYEELMELYHSGLKGVPSRLAGVAPYARYITWLEERDKKNSLQFWQKELAGYQVETVLPGQHGSSQENQYDAHVVQLSCDAALGIELSELASRWQVTVSTIIHTLWGVLLGWYNDSDDVVFGSVVSGRPESLIDAERMVGLCINTVPVRIRLPGSVSIQQLALDLQKQFLAASEHHYCNLAEIQNVTVPKQKLINHIIAVENFPRTSVNNIEGVSIEPTGSHEQIQYDLALVVVPLDPFEIELRYNRAVYTEAAVTNIARHLCTLLETIVATPQISIEQCEPLTPEEHALLDGLNETKRDVNLETTPLNIFEQQVADTPTAPAVIDHDGCIDYQQLSTLAERIAGYLNRHPAYEPGASVAVMIERCRWLPAALFGIWKAGGTYVPLDPRGPESRASAILQDCGCNIVLSMPQVLESLYLEGDIHIADITRLDNEVGLPEPLPVLPASTAYIIYTSGSTGTPKGVAIAHSSVVNFAAWVSRYYGIDRSTRSTLFASPAFDASILEMIPTLLNGGSLHCSRETLVDGEDLITFYREHSINLSFLAPILCEEICRIHDGRLPADFRLMTGADVLRYAGDGSLRVFNNYGPTEATVIATATEVTGLGSDNVIPIGFPIDNAEIFIFDHYGRKAAPGAVGELHVGGAGVAQGYLGRKELNRECFLPHPQKKAEKIYRTGDRVRFIPAKGLEFLGRIDNQIQLHGYRIELLEIEHALRKHREVRNAAVIDRETSSGSILIAFLTPRSEGRVPTDELRSFLHSLLPEYMIPVRYCWMERLPLTISGKIDRESLLKTELVAEPDSPEVTDSQPLTPIEKQLAEIWRDVIGVDSVGRNDNFFALGGHSLSATRVASRVRRDLSLELSLRDIFDIPVLADLAKHLEKDLTTIA